jgi:amino acid transporter
MLSGGELPLRLGLLVLLSIIGAVNGWGMAAPRIYFAQAGDGLFLRRFAIITAVAPGFVVKALVATSARTIPGTFLIAAGVPVHFIWKHQG